MLASQVYSVPPVERALKLLRHIADGDPVINVSLAARTLRISRTTLIRLLATLESERMIEQRREGGYKLGLGLASLAAQALFSRDVVEQAEPILARLAEALGVSAHLGVLEDREVLYVARRTPNLHLISNVRIGSRLPAHATSIGRIILAHLQNGEVAQRFGSNPLPQSTPKTPTTLAKLEALISQDRLRGVAWSDSNFELGISSVAAPVFDHANAIVAGLNVTGPTEAFDTHPHRRAEIESAVRRAARELSARLGHVASLTQSESQERAAE